MKNVMPAFWDASAVVPLCVPEFSSAQLHRTTLLFRPIVVWWATPLEVLSACARLAHRGDLATNSLQRARNSLAELRRLWVEIIPSDEVRDLGELLLLKHQLRAGDALQLAAALVWCSQYPRNRPFVCFDHRLAKAATEIGFTIIGEKG